MEYLDIVDEQGNPTGQTVERSVAHGEGIRHRTAHVWLVRKRGDSLEILLQKRCDAKESYPGCYDISSAGHIPAGVDFAASAIRELKEELGVEAEESELLFCGDCMEECDAEFQGKPFHDREYSRVFALWCDREEAAFRLQPEEVSAVRWMGLDALMDAVDENSIPNCIFPEELPMVRQTVLASRRAVVYIHGKGGSPEEAEHYAPLFPGSRVIGLPYEAQTPWEAREEFPRLLEALCREQEEIWVIANSIGAYFLMNAPEIPKLRRAWFLSPVVDMEGLIGKMMLWANVTEADLQAQKTIPTNFGETLSWDYLTYVRSHPLEWRVPTHILCGAEDTMTDYSAAAAFAEKTGASLDLLMGAEHWFHTPEQMECVDAWIDQLRDLKTRTVL